MPITINWIALFSFNHTYSANFATKRPRDILLGKRKRSRRHQQAAPKAPSFLPHESCSFPSCLENRNSLL